MHALATLTLVVPLLLPAASPGPAGAATPAADKDCGKATTEIDVDLDTGLIHAFDGTSWTTLDGELVLHTGDADAVAVEIHYSSGEWVASIATDAGTSTRVETSRGVARFWLDADAQRAVISSSPRRDGAAAMTAMTPVVPDIILRPKPDCPPPT